MQHDFFSREDRTAVAVEIEMNHVDSHLHPRKMSQSKEDVEKCMLRGRAPFRVTEKMHEERMEKMEEKERLTVIRKREAGKRRLLLRNLRRNYPL